ncbi:hypothetical protein AB0F96_38775 [Streptomyces sp. NPDC023998]|uniref:hypothetical protein n=1 Tax=Streptomyces sp. NPDC023998 TaxID=3154597 RepID=UPI0033DF574D
MADYDFPRDLRDAQLCLHHVRAEYSALCRTLPWSVEPAEGWSGDKQLYSEYLGTMPDSPGYTEQQKAEEARLRRRVLDLSIAVSTHPYWATVVAETVVEQRMALKHTPGALTQPFGEEPAPVADPSEVAVLVA